ncbi:MAG TPA: hypothetical protein G4O13_07760 [Dehalococcoidia bacterium]|nr:hypothetical protein [Dehalococcoidia bacterium]
MRWLLWLRRTTAVFLAFIFLILFTVVLLTTQVSNTVTSAGFYNRQLEQADMYNFIYDELLPAALDDLQDDSEDIPVDLQAIEDDLIAAARKMLPPEWLQEQVESATDTIIPYLLSDTDEFTYTVELKERVEAIADVVKEDLLKGDVSQDIYDDLVSYAAEEGHENLDKLPYTLALSKEQIEDALKTVISRDWLISQLVAAIDSALPYFTRDADSFTITVYFEDRVDPLAEALIDLLGTEENYDDLLTLATPLIEDEIGSTIELYRVHNSGKKVALSTKDDIVPAMKDALSYTWVQEQFAEIVNAVAAYVKGEADDIEVPIDLTDKKENAVDAVATLADDRLEALFLGLPQCSLAEFNIEVASLPPFTQPPYTLPDRRASGMSYDEFKQTLGIHIDEVAEEEVGDKLPDHWVYTYDDLTLSLGEVDDDFIDDVREWVDEGWSYSDADLLEDIGSDGEETLEDAREWIATGYTVTEEDLREVLSENEEDLGSFDDVRRWTGVGTTWLWVLWLLPVFLLISIGFLGGRNWGSRIAWALAVLLFASLALYIAAGVTYAHVGEPRIEEALPDPSEYEGVTVVLIEKGNEAIVNAADSFVSGIQCTTLGLWIGSAAALLYIAGCSIYNRRHPPQEAEPEDSARLVLVRFFGVDGDDSD